MSGMPMSSRTTSACRTCLDHRVAGHVRHADVEQDDVGAELADRLERLLAAGDAAHLVPLVLEQRGERAHGVDVVVGDHHSKAPAHDRMFDATGARGNVFGHVEFLLQR
jgi:hypothetical protein